MWYNDADDIADDWVTFEAYFMYRERFHYLYLKNTALYNVWSQLPSSNVVC